MVRKYIMDNTKYPRATGGTPITTWLPNQIGACLEQCQVFIQNIDSSKLTADQRVTFDKIHQDVDMQITRLFSEVDQLQTDFKGQDYDQFKSRKQL